jgi:hypothetical protein
MSLIVAVLGSKSDCFLSFYQQQTIYLCLESITTDKKMFYGILLNTEATFSS